MTLTLRQITLRAVVCLFLALPSTSFAQAPPQQSPSEAFEKATEQTRRAHEELDRMRQRMKQKEAEAQRGLETALNGDEAEAEREEIEKLRRRVEQLELLLGASSKLQEGVSNEKKYTPEQASLYHRLAREDLSEAFKDSIHFMRMGPDALRRELERYEGRKAKVIARYGSMEAYGEIIYAAIVRERRREVLDILQKVKEERSRSRFLSHETKRKLMAIGKLSRAGEHPYNEYLNQLETAWNGVPSSPREPNREEK